MKVFIIGATGPTGQQLVQQALAQGHEVTALARNPAAITNREVIAVTPGDVLNPASLNTARQNQ